MTCLASDSTHLLHYQIYPSLKPEMVDKLVCIRMNKASWSSAVQRNMEEGCTIMFMELATLSKWVQEMHIWKVFEHRQKSFEKNQPAIFKNLVLPEGPTKTSQLVTVTSPLLPNPILNKLKTLSISYLALVL